jgi:hypothetical protein
MSKTYTVVKDGTELKELKTLAAAKKVADAEAAEVYCEGECVYPEAVAAPAESAPALPSHPACPKNPCTQKTTKNNATTPHGRGMRW